MNRNILWIMMVVGVIVAMGGAFHMQTKLWGHPYSFDSLKYIPLIDWVVFVVGSIIHFVGRHWYIRD